MAGLTATGIEIKDVSEIVDDLGSEQIANIDANLNLEPDDVLGQLNAIVGAAIAEAWELLEEIYHSAYPDTASGQSLSYVSALTGTVRREATKALLDVDLGGTALAPYPAGMKVYPNSDPDAIFESTAAGALDGLGLATITMQAVDAGDNSNIAAGGENMTFVTPVSGITSAISSASGVNAPGLDEETDDELRVRREQSLALAGASTVDAIRAEMLQVTGVDSCTVFENPTGVIDAIGIPPYAIEVLVNSEAAPNYTDQDIWDAILLRKPAGTETYGTESGTATDSSGNSYTVKFSEPNTVRTYVELDITVDSDFVEADVETAVAASIANWATQSLLVGQDVFASDIINVAADVEGVTSIDVTQTFVDDDATPSPNTSLVITPRQLATIDAADVTVTAV